MAVRPMMGRRAMVLGLASAAAACAPAALAKNGATAQAAYEGITFESGRRVIRAIDYHPAGEGRRAAIVMMHGAGARIANRGPWHALAARFANDGYRVLTPLFTDAEPDDGIRPPTTMERWRDVGRDAIEALIAEGYEPDRTGMFGYSLGAYLAVDGALGDSRAGSAIALAGGVDIYPPRAPRRRIPVLILRADHDTHVLPASTAAWLRFLADHDIPVRERVIRNSDHLFTAEKWVEIHALASTFFDGNIGRVS